MWKRNKQPHLAAKHKPMRPTEMADAWMSERRQITWRRLGAPSLTQRGNYSGESNEDCNNNVAGLIRAGSGPLVLLQEPIRNIYTHRQTRAHTVWSGTHIRSLVCTERCRRAAGLANEKPRANPVMLMKACGTLGSDNFHHVTARSVCVCVLGAGGMAVGLRVLCLNLPY